jgi:hypothetical protein
MDQADKAVKQFLAQFEQQQTVSTSQPCAYVRAFFHFADAYYRFIIPPL